MGFGHIGDPRYEQPQSLCGQRAAFRFTWTNDQTGLICAEHAEKMRRVAEVIGYDGTRYQAVDDANLRCEQKVGHRKAKEQADG